MENSLNSKSTFKIGKFVRLKFISLFKNNEISSAECKLLCDKAYCKKVFNTKYPVLVKKDENKLRDRYYSPKKLVLCNGNDQYLLTNDWFEFRNRGHLNIWLSKF